MCARSQRAHLFVSNSPVSLSVLCALFFVCCNFCSRNFWQEQNILKVEFSIGNTVNTKASVFAKSTTQSVVLASGLLKIHQGIGFSIVCGYFSMRGRGIFQPQKPEQICSYRFGRKRSCGLVRLQGWIVKLTLNPLDGGRGMKSIPGLFIRLTVQKLQGEAYLSLGNMAGFITDRMHESQPWTLVENIGWGLRLLQDL